MLNENLKFKKAIKNIEANIKYFSVDDIKNILDPYLLGIRKRCPVFNAGNFFYRARLVNSYFSKYNVTIRDLSYPFSNSQLGRANRENSPMFYCSSGKEAIFYELDVKEGDEFILGNWKNTEKLLVNNIGYTEECFIQMSANRPPPDWSGEISGPNKMEIDPKINSEITSQLKSLRNTDIDYDINNIFGLEFIKSSKSAYKLTAAIAEMHLGKADNKDISGIIYPSVRMSANGDNLALLPKYVDRHMQLVRVSHVKVLERKGSTITFSEVDHAIDFLETGYPNWKGRTLRWTMQSQEMLKFVVEKGIDDFGFYELGKNGEPLHWQAYDENGIKVNPD